jgi:hypothetical protein
MALPSQKRTHGATLKILFVWHYRPTKEHMGPPLKYCLFGIADPQKNTWGHP